MKLKNMLEVASFERFKIRLPDNSEWFLEWNGQIQKWHDVDYDYVYTAQELDEMEVLSIRVHGCSLLAVLREPEQV